MEEFLPAIDKHLALKQLKNLNRITIEQYRILTKQETKQAVPIKEVDLTPLSINGKFSPTRIA